MPVRFLCFLMACAAMIGFFPTAALAEEPEDVVDAEYVQVDDDQPAEPVEDVLDPDESFLDGSDPDDPILIGSDLYQSDFIESDLISDEEEELEPVEGEITDAQFKSYVLGCLFFFVVVILAYFGYRFFDMFF